jgi:cytochrome c peroxidase
MHLLALVLLVADPKVELGRRLFMDPTVSRSGRFSCASCHDPEHGFSDPRRLSIDENGKTRRHSQPVVDLAGGESFHWDGEFESVRDLLVARLGTLVDAADIARTARTRQFAAARTDGLDPDGNEFHRVLSGLPTFNAYYGPATSSAPVAVRVDEDGLYADGFRAAFGSSEATTERIIDALLAYVHSLRSAESPLDRFLAGAEDAISPAQRRGFDLFVGRAGCAACHSLDAGDDGRPTLTDGRFHNTGVAFRFRPPREGGERVVEGRPPDGGAGEMNFVERDLGKFKTPSLRDVARRPPYMHDGSLATLEDVVRYYSRGCTPNEHIDGQLMQLDLPEREIRDLVAFLESLTGDERPGLGPTRRNVAWLRVRVVDPEGRPLERLPIHVRPAGDRLEGGRADAPPMRLRTDAWGYLSFRFPASTHVRFEGPLFEYAALIPDCTTRAEVIAAPRDMVLLEVRGIEPPRRQLPFVRDENIPGFRLLRSLGGGRALYAAEPRWSLLGVSPRATASVRGVKVDLDLSGGWTAPIDLRRG